MERFGFGGFERGDDFGGVFLAEAARGFLGAEVEVGEGFLVEAEEVERRLAMAVADERLGDDFSQTIEVERLAGGEVFDAGDGLRGALEIRAAPGDEAFLLADRSAAGRAFSVDAVVERIGNRALRVADDLDDGGDDFSGFFHEHGRAEADVLAVDLVLVVQRGAGDGGAGNEHGCELGDGCQHAGAADLDDDVVERGFLLLGQEFIGGGPARGAGGEAELLALGAVEDLDDGSVGAVVEGVALAVDAGDGFEHFVEIVGVEDRLVLRDAEIG